MRPKRFRWTAATLATALVLTMSGCDRTPTSNSPKGDSGTSVRVVTLDDGTRCAVMDKPGGGGVAVDCNWRTP